MASLLPAARSDVDVRWVSRFQRGSDIDLAGRKNLMREHDPRYVAKSAAVIELFGAA